jgi:hypothetical protein
VFAQGEPSVATGGLWTQEGHEAREAAGERLALDEVTGRWWPVQRVTYPVNGLRDAGGGAVQEAISKVAKVRTALLLSSSPHLPSTARFVERECGVGAAFLVFTWYVAGAVFLTGGGVMALARAQKAGSRAPEQLLTRLGELQVMHACNERTRQVRSFPSSPARPWRLRCSHGPRPVVE